MEEFNALACEYMKNHSSNLLSAIEDVLKKLDISQMIDPTSSLSVHFFVNIHNILNAVEINSSLVPHAFNLLEKICQTSAIRLRTISLENFIPVLARFFDYSTNQLQLLRILSEVTYNVKIAWEEAYLSTLIPLLSKNVVDGQGDERRLSLVALINLCYENLPVLYVFVRKVDTKALIKRLTALNDDPTIMILVYKMLIILQEIKGPLPEADIMNFIVVAIDTIHDCFNQRDAYALQQMVDFFKSEHKKEYLSNAIGRYRNSEPETKRLLKLIEEANENDGGCIASIINFLPCILTPRTNHLIPRVVISTRKWLLIEATTLSAINLLHITLQKTRSLAFLEENDAHIFTETLPTLVELFKVRGPHSCKYQHLAQLSLVLLEMLINDYLSSAISKVLSSNTVEKMLAELMKDTTKEGNEFFVRLLRLVSLLSPFSSEWMLLYEKSLSQKEVLSKISEAFIAGDRNTKLAVFNLIKSPGWSDENLVCFCDLLKTWPCSHDQLKEPTYIPPPFYSFTQESRLNEALTECRSSNRPSSIMELCRFQLLLSEHEEKRLKTWLAASEASNTALQHQNNLLKSEMSHFSETLFQKQQLLEETCWERNELLKKESEHLSIVEAMDREIKSLKLEVENLVKVNSSTVDSLNSMTNELHLRETELEEARSEVAVRDAELQDCRQTIADLERIRKIVANAVTKQDWTMTKTNSQIE